MLLIETDRFPFEFLSRLAERESWRKEVHRPIYHIHKWWAKRLGSVFRGILLGCNLQEHDDLKAEFYRFHDVSGVSVFDPFLGSGTTIGEAHKLGLTALGRDINPVAVESTRTAFGRLNRGELTDAFEALSQDVGSRIRSLYHSEDSRSRPCDVLYYFWVMQVPCLHCRQVVGLFPSWVVARNAYPSKKPEIQVLCPSCTGIFPGTHGREATCPQCGLTFQPGIGTAKGANASCSHCNRSFSIIKAVNAAGLRPSFKLLGKLVLTGEGGKEYLPATTADRAAYDACAQTLSNQVDQGAIELPSLALGDGYNTRQAMSYLFTNWRDFFNDRQLLTLSWLHQGIRGFSDRAVRDAFLTLFSGILEFNNMFASYKGEGTGAVRHMFSHHILKPERTPIEANVWGTPKSSGSFSNLFRSRLLRAVDYRATPTEVNGTSRERGRVCSGPFSGAVESRWPKDGQFSRRGIYLSCGDSSTTDLPDGSIDLIVTDPPFFDNVHYSELADFFHAWQQLGLGRVDQTQSTTRSPLEVQDPDASEFARKLQAVLVECRRVLKDNGLLVFTYHHSRDEGWQALAEAVLGAGFVIVNSHPVKGEMSVATPKSQAKEPIQLDIIIVCRNRDRDLGQGRQTVEQAIASATVKLRRLHRAGFNLSRNDRRIVLYGQLSCSLRSTTDVQDLGKHVEAVIDSIDLGESTEPEQRSLFEDRPA